MKNIAILFFTLAVSLPAICHADSTTSGLPNGGVITTTDMIPIARCASPGCNYRVTVGPIAPLGIGAGLAASAGNLVLGIANSSPGTFGTASTVPQVTIDGNGRVTAATPVTITPAAIGAPTNGGTGATGTWSIDITGNATNITGSSNSTLTSLPNLSLPYTQLTGAPATGVSSVFGRAGPVTAQTNDYSFSQLSGTVNLSTQGGGTLQAAQEPAHTGDVTNTAGSLAMTLATVNSNVGSFGGASSVPNFTVNAKGQMTAAGAAAVVAPAGTLSGATLNSGVVNSSLTSLGTIGTGIWNATPIGQAYGGTGYFYAGAGGGTGVGGDDCPLIQTAINDAEFFGNGVVVFNPYATPPISTGSPTTNGTGAYICLTDLTLDPSEVSGVGNGAFIDFSSQSSGAAITIAQTSQLGLNTNFRNSFGNLNFIGPSGANTLGLLVFNTTGSSSTTSSRYTIHDITAKGFAHDEVYQSGAYAIDVHNYDYNDATVSAVYIPSNATNTGEAITHDGVGIISNSPLAIDSEASNGTDTLTFIGLHSDQNVQTAQATRGFINLVQPWIELNGTTNLAGPILVASNNTGASINIQGGTLLLDGSGPFSTASALLDAEGTATTGGSITIRDMFMHNIGLTSATMGTGGGQISVTGTRTYDSDTTNSMLASLTNTFTNGMIDGGFESSSLKDFIIITKDTAAITSRLTGTNITIALDTNSSHCAPHAGSHALAVDKIGAAATNAAFAVLVPIPEHANIMDAMYYSVPGTSTGSFTIQNNFVSLQGSDGNGIPVIGFPGPVDAVITVTLSGSPVAYTQYIKGIGTKNIAPEYANYQDIVVDLTAAPAGWYCFDDFIFSHM